MNDRLAVYMLDVGQGDSTVVLLPNGHAVVFDCADDHVLRNLLEAWEVTVIDAFVLSHLDQDHIAGALQFLMGWPHSVRRVCLSTDRDLSDTHEEAKRAKSLVDYVVEKNKDSGAQPRRWELLPNVRDPRPLVEGQDWSVRLLAPSHAQSLRREREGAWEDANRYSSILRVEAGGNVMLIGGDAPLLTWSELPAGERKARVVRISHHGGALDDGGVPPGWDVQRLYKEVGAETALISVGTNNAHGHPKQPWVAPLTGGACRLRCTQVTARCHAPLETVAADGSISRDEGEISLQRERLLGEPGFKHWVEAQWRHLTDRRQQVRKGLLEVPCAGTVLVELHLNGDVRIRPTENGDHERVVDGWHNPLSRASSP